MTTSSSLLLLNKAHEYKGPSFTHTFGNMDLFQPPQMPFKKKPRLVTDEELTAFREKEGASLRAIRGLQELDLSGCSNLTDVSITQVLRFPLLQRLSLIMLTEISDEGVASVALHCRCLTSLSLSGCSQLTDAGLARALPCLQRLQHLQLAYCNGITDRSLSLIVQHCRRLRTLDICMCRDITVSKVDFLQSQLPFLEKVSSTGMHDLIECPRACAPNAIGQLINALIGRLINALIGRLINALIGRLISAQIGRLINAQIGRLISAQIGRLITQIGRLINALIGRLINALIGRLIRDANNNI
ncbi:F-box/LRR-repeat protein 3 [Tachysurus ichikawai]